MMLPITVESETIVRFGAQFGVTFQRTLRVPDDGRVYHLPPGIGTFPVLRVEDYADRVPQAWHQHGGVFLPLYQREALWLGSQGANWKPHAVKVGVGRVNAITGGPWDVALPAQEQDYLVCPPQLWLDGIKSGSGYIRQFVAAPLGHGVTVEAQMTGADTFGGLQVGSSRHGRGGSRTLHHRPPGAHPGSITRPRIWRAAQVQPHGNGESGTAAGGTIEQKIYPESLPGMDTWDADNYGSLWVHLVNSEQFRACTGREPPSTPITARLYTDYGLPWFALYDEEAGTSQPPNAWPVSSPLDKSRPSAARPLTPRTRPLQSRTRA